jgi:hypothetical protein
MSDEANQSDLEAEAQSAAMNNQLRNDVANWKAGRSEENALRTESSTPVVKPAVAKPTPRSRAPKAAAAPPVVESGKKKPFGMSYDGMSQADYITYRISRGAR